MTRLQASSSSPLGVLTYASPDVRTAPPRTLLRMFAAGVLWLARLLVACVRLSILAAGYMMLAAGIALRFCFGLTAMLLLFIGGLRWKLVRSQVLRAAEWVDRKTLRTIDLLRRLVPLRLRT